VRRIAPVVASPSAISGAGTSRWISGHNGWAGDRNRTACPAGASSVRTAAGSRSYSPPKRSVGIASTTGPGQHRRLSFEATAGTDVQ
jgi:hypothetical protein